MKQLLGICLALVVVSGCVSAERRAEIEAEAAKCESSGGTAYIGYDELDFCASPSEQARFERLEIACLEGGGEVRRKYGRYKGCEQPQPKTNITINNKVSTKRECIFKMACKD